jgi:hypothetical protein
MHSSPLLLAALATLATTGVFLAIHLAVARISGQRFRRSLKLSRGIAATILVATGAATLVRWWPLWNRTFIALHTDPVETWPVAVFAGHLAADLAWLLGGRVFLEARAARDLVIHHLLGIAGCVAAVVFGAGYALIGVVLLSEVLPVLTGLGALARTWRLENLEHWVLRASLAAIVGFRIPLWLFLGTTLIASLATGTAGAIHHAVAPIALPGLALVLVLDLYWIRSYRRLLADFPRRGVPDLPLDPLAPWFLEES